MITQAQKDVLSSLNQGNARRAELVRCLDQSEKVAAFSWAFAADGGAAADYDSSYLTEEAVLVTKVVIHEIDNVTCVNSTYTVKAGSTALTGAIAVGSVATGAVTLASSATAIPVAAGQVLRLTIGTAPATAGTLRIYVHMLPQRDM